MFGRWAKSRRTSSAIEADTRDAVHLEPVWKARADFLIVAAVPDTSRAEQLWARRVSSDRVEICCIPFFLYDVALGDIVETDDRHNLVRVVERSGRFVFRLWFGDSLTPKEPVAVELAGRGALLEWSSRNLLAIDARDEVHAEELAGYLAQLRSDGLIYETGRS